MQAVGESTHQDEAACKESVCASKKGVFGLLQGVVE